MKTRVRRASHICTLLHQADKHESVADALADAAEAFARQREEALVSASLKACHAHRVWALLAVSRAHALSMLGDAGSK